MQLLGISRFGHISSEFNLFPERGFRALYTCQGWQGDHCRRFIPHVGAHPHITLQPPLTRKCWAQQRSREAVTHHSKLFGINRWEAETEICNRVRASTRRERVNTGGCCVRQIGPS